MRRHLKRLLIVLLMGLLVLGLSVTASAKSKKSKKKKNTDTTTVVTAAPSSSESGSSASKKKDASKTDSGPEVTVEEDGEYTSKEEVALYLHTYGHLPSNFITKKEANDLGWSGGSLEPYASGKSIGGSRFGNYEEVLPTKKGRQYYECDIDYDGEKRNAKRIVWSDDGLIFYTEDHYKTFEQLY